MSLPSNKVNMAQAQAQNHALGLNLSIIHSCVTLNGLPSTPPSFLEKAFISPCGITA